MMNRIIPCQYIKQTNTGGLWLPASKKFTKTDIPNRKLKNGKMIRQVGCGQCCVSMALSFITGKFIEPDSLDDRLSNSGGSYHDIGAYEAKKRGIETEYTTSIKKVMDALEKGYPAMSIQGKGTFTSSGHYILLTGIKDGKIAVLDPASYYRTYATVQKLYSPEEIDKAAKKSDGKAYTIFKRKQFTVNVSKKLNIWKEPKKTKSLGYLEDGQKVTVIDDEPIFYNGLYFVKVKKTKGVKDLALGVEYPVIGYVDRKHLV